MVDVVESLSERTVYGLAGQTTEEAALPWVTLGSETQRIEDKGHSLYWKTKQNQTHIANLGVKSAFQ